MNDTAATLRAYVESTAALTEMPLTPERADEIAVVMTRIAAFAAHLGAFALDDEIEIAGLFRP